MITSNDSGFRALYQQEQIPIFQNRMYDSEAEARACPRGDMRLVQAQKSGLIFNDSFRPELMEYDAQYQNEQAHSGSFRQHLEDVCQIVNRCMGRESLVEVGCGKGAFLEMLLAQGLCVRGFDRTYDGDNPNITPTYFDPSAETSPGGFILRHVLEHIPDPFSFLSGLRGSTGGESRVYIEVPCFDWICDHRAWFDVHYEHVNYFRMRDFSRMFGDVIECGRLFGGQYLYVVADLATLRVPLAAPGDSVTLPTSFMPGVVHSHVGAQPSAIWGAASKGVIFALLRERAGCPVSTAIDINPLKQGRYLPAVGLRVQSPKEALAALPRGSTIYVMNSNYFDEIVSMSDNSFNYVRIDNG